MPLRETMGSGSHWAFRASALLRAEFSFLSAQSVRNRWRVRFVCLSESRQFGNSVASWCGWR